MKKFWFGKRIFVYIGSTEIFFSKLRSAGLNYKFFTDSYCAGVSNKHCLLTFFIDEGREDPNTTISGPSSTRQ